MFPGFWKYNGIEDVWFILEGELLSGKIDI